MVTATTYYVATTGSNLNDGSIDSSWQTASYAIQHTQPGDTILVREGTYTNDEIRIRVDYGGAPGQVKTLMAYPGEEVILSGSLILIDTDYVRVQGFILNNKALRIEGSHLEILDNRFNIWNESTAIKFTGALCNNNLIEGNVITSNQQIFILKYGISFYGGSHNIFRNNIISDFVENGIYIYDAYATTSDMLIENNIIRKSKFRSGIIVHTTSRSNIDGVKIRNNVFEDNAQFGVELTGRVRNVQIYNNTFIQASLDSIPYVYGNDRCGIYISELPEFVEIKNNIFYNKDTLGTHINFRYGALPATITHNLYWPAPPKLVIFDYKWEDILGTVEDEHPIIGDPLFVNLEAANYFLTIGSPAIDAGLNIGLPYMWEAPDLGAFESEFSEVKQTPSTMIREFRLEPCYPNPFNSSTKIVYDIPVVVDVEVAIFNELGHQVIQLVNEKQTAGQKQITWNGTDERGLKIASGLYFIRLRASEFIAIRKVAYIR